MKADNGGRTGKAVKTRPTIVTVDKGGRKRKWGPLSRDTAWRAGSFWEEMGGDAKVFLEKDGKMNEVSVEKLVGKGGPRFLFKDKKPDSPQRPDEKRDDLPVTEEASGTEEVADESTTEEPVTAMSEDDREERETAHKMWLSEKVTFLENENRELKKALQEMESRLASKKQHRGKLKGDVPGSKLQS